MKNELGLRGLLMMYVGNLEPYQGIGLLLESFAIVLGKTDVADLVIIGGKATDIDKYQKRARELRIEQRVHFLGPRPLDQLRHSLSEADVVISPRIKGNNTPMKIYSYLHSGKPLLATDLPTHTQVLDSRVAMLASPSPEAFSTAMLRLIEDKGLRAELGKAGEKLIEERYTVQVFRERVNSLLDWLQTELVQDSAVAGGTSRPRRRASVDR